MMPGSGEDVVRETGGQIDGIVMALIESSHDKNENVMSSMCKSLFCIGKHQPNLVLTSCHSYLKSHPKLPLDHKILILNVMEQVCNETLKSIQKPVAVDLIKLSIEEMVSSKEIVPEWQNVVSGILVSLGRNFHHEVMEQLIVKLQPGVLPHFFVLQTMANLASANVYGMVPFLKAVLGTILPLLCSIKQENMKWIFAYALSKFSDAINEYIANVDKAPDPTVSKEAFEGEISSAYYILLNNWIQSRESKVRSEVVVALGHMTHLLDAEKVEELLPKLLPAILAMYKRHQEFQYTTQGLCMVLEAAVAHKSTVLDTQLDNIMNVLFPQICTLPDYSVPSSVRNHNEVLRCFAVLAALYCERIISFLQLKLESNNESYRVGSLIAIKHLINSSIINLFPDVLLKNKIPNIIQGLKVAMDSSNKVKKVIAQVIVALAHHGYLENDGGPDMVWFIASQCALADDQHIRRPTDASFVSNEALRAMCENVIQLLTTTVENISNILWLCLFDCLVSEPLTSAVGVLCKNLTTLANKRREEEGSSFTIDYSNFVNVTNPQTLFARLIVLTGFPHSGRGRGAYILQFLRSISPAISRSLQALWDTKIPPLVQHLENADVSEWDQQDWESQITEFFSLTLGELDREEWTIKLGNVFRSQISLYTNMHEEKYILLKFLGIIMRKVTNKSFINQSLDCIFDNVNHHIDIERLGCALAVGYCAATHLDLVLVKLEQIAKDDRKTGFFNFIMDFKGDVDHEKLKTTIILCYGHVTVNGPSPILSMRIETPILRSVLNFYTSSKDPLVKETMLETIKLIAEAIHPSKMSDGFILRSRNELLNLMKNIMKGEVSSSITSSVRSLALNASAHLVALDPVLKDDEKCSLIEVAVSSVYSLPKEMHTQKLRDDIVDLNVDLDNFLFAALDALNALLENLLLKEKNHLNLQTMFQILCVWLNSKYDVERERCMNSALHLIRSYARATENEGFSPFISLGLILGIFIPRCTDPQTTVRHLAFDCIDAVLSLSLRLQAPSSPASPVQEPDGLSVSYLKQQINCDDPSALFAVTKELGRYISERLPVEQLASFLRTLISGLCDPHPQSSSGTSVVLNKVIKLRGRELRQDSSVVLECLREQLPLINCPQTQKGALLAIQNLALFNSITVLSSLLGSNLPLDIYCIQTWKTLVRDENLANLIMDHCLEILSETIISIPPDPHGRNSSPVAMFKPLAAICALKEIFKVAEMTKICKEKFDQIFSALLLAIGQYMHAVPPTAPEEPHHPNIVISKKSTPKHVSVSPIRCAMDALKYFLICVHEDAIVSSLADNGDWLLLEDPEKYPDAIGTIGKYLCANCADYIPKTMAYLNPMLNSTMDSQRIVTVTLFVEFLRQDYKGQKVLVEPLISNLLGRLSDSSRTVRRLCIRGLGSMGQLFKEQGQRYSTALLSAMVAGMDDKDDPSCDITLEAINGLSSILPVASEEEVQKLLINVSLKVKQMFEKERPAVRTAAFTLFGRLSQFGSGPLKDEFVSQIHSNIVSFLLHLNDEDKQVIKSCKSTMRLIGPFLESKEINEMFQKHLLDDAHLHYGEFLNGVTKLLIQDFPDKLSSYATTCTSYLKSPFSAIQCNASAFLGYLMGNLPEVHRESMPTERICAGLVSLLKDQSADVRMRAAEALSLLYEY